MGRGRPQQKGIDFDKLSLLSLKLVVLCVWALYASIVAWLSYSQSERGIDPEADPRLRCECPRSARNLAGTPPPCAGLTA